MSGLSLRAAALLGAIALTVAASTVPAVSSTPVSERALECFDPGAGARSAGGVRGVDHRDVSVSEQRAIERRTAKILAAQGGRPSAGASAGSRVAVGRTVPVYVHVMLGSDGAGDVTAAQISSQIAILNTTFGGSESGEASKTGFTFSLARVDKWKNDGWHADRSSSKYRAKTRLGGANALNVWLVDFKYLGIATFPWDFKRSGAVDGIRVDYATLPGGSIANFNLGKTATHEVGHWLGLYHTFQGGCTERNDEVADTPAQSGPSSGCPEGLDSCASLGLDPIHNYMDYSFDICYDQFTANQSTRMASMWASYRIG